MPSPRRSKRSRLPLLVALALLVLTVVLVIRPPEPVVLAASALYSILAIVELLRD